MKTINDYMLEQENQLIDFFIKNGKTKEEAKLMWNIHKISFHNGFAKACAVITSEYRGTDIINTSDLFKTMRTILDKKSIEDLKVN